MERRTRAAVHKAVPVMAAPGMDCNPGIGGTLSEKGAVSYLSDTDSSTIPGLTCPD